MFLVDALEALRVRDFELFWKRLVLCGTPSWGCIISQNSRYHCCGGGRHARNMNLSNLSSSIFADKECFECFVVINLINEALWHPVEVIRRMTCFALHARFAQSFLLHFLLKLKDLCTLPPPVLKLLAGSLWVGETDTMIETYRCL